MEEGEQPVLAGGGKEGLELGDVQTVPGSRAGTRGRFARSTGLLPMRPSMMTASRNAFRRIACR
jgi:hypothetical protein